MTKTPSLGARLADLRWAKAPEAERERLRTLRSKPTLCPRCGELQPSARQARTHCRIESKLVTSK